MIYLVLKPGDLVGRPFFRFVWYWFEYFFRVYNHTTFNLRRVKFGRFTDFFRKLTYTVVHTFKLIDIDYIEYFKGAFDNYDTLRQSV